MAVTINPASITDINFKVFNKDTPELLRYLCRFKRKYPDRHNDFLRNFEVLEKSLYRSRFTPGLASKFFAGNVY